MTGFLSLCRVEKEVISEFSLLNWRVKGALVTINNESDQAT